MVRWHPDFYMTGEARDDIEEIKTSVEEGKTSCRAYLITLSSNPAEQLDIYTLRMFLRSRAYRSQDPLIVGVAKTRKQALYLLETMAADIYDKTGDCDFRSYFDLI